MTEVVGAILLGGASRRMGRPKALVPAGGTALARRVAGALVAGGVTRLELIGDDAAIARSVDVGDLIDRWGSRADRWKGIGPLGGLVTAVSAADTAQQSGDRLSSAPRTHGAEDAIIVVAACDQPDLVGTTIRRLVEALAQAEPTAVAAAIVTEDGRRHPFPSAWRATAGPALEALVHAGARRADAGFSIGPVVEVTAFAAELVDLDTPGDLARWNGQHEGPERPGGEAPGDRP